MPEERAIFESYVLRHKQIGEGERRWLTRSLIDNDIDRGVRYGAEHAGSTQRQA